MKSLLFITCGVWVAVSSTAPNRAAAQTSQTSPPVPAEILGAGSGPAIEIEGRGEIESGWAVEVDAGGEFTLRLAEAADEEEKFAGAETGQGALDVIQRVEWSLPGGSVAASLDGRLRVTAPKTPGAASLRLSSRGVVAAGGRSLASGAAVAAQLVLLTRAPHDRAAGTVAGYPIGVYPNERGKAASGFVKDRPELYEPPKGFFEVTPQVRALHVSRRFTVGDFIPPVAKTETRYMTISPRLIECLEAVDEAARSEFNLPDSGRAVIRILVGFLTPLQLDQIRAEGVKLADFSRYQYGDAAGVIVDANGDGRLDDLDRNGATDLADTNALAALIETTQKRLKKYGGVGVVETSKIPSLAAAGPYVDFDMRGVASRW